jgi:hypothetical protein
MVQSLNSVGSMLNFLEVIQRHETVDLETHRKASSNSNLP